MKFLLVEDIHDELETAEQSISSAATSINSSKLPAIFKLVKFDPNTVNLDYGGGRFDNATDYLATIDVENLIYDPYNRTTEHNSKVISRIRHNGGADTATCSNVLNVIKEPAARATVIKNISTLLKNSGTAYFTVYEGTGMSDERETKAGYQLNRPTAAYVEEISKYFSNVRRKGKLIIAQK